MCASPADDAALRDKLGALLRDGLQTEWCDRADSSQEVNRVVAMLAAVGPADHRALLRIAGFTPAAFQPEDADDIAQACETCMYFVIHRKFCDLPELRIPVQPEWSCRLWRI